MTIEVDGDVTKALMDNLRALEPVQQVVLIRAI